MFRMLPTSASLVAITTAIMLLTAAAQTPKVTATLLSDVLVAAPGDTIRAGILFSMPKDAHIYWHNPGDSGLPTVVEWNKTDGVQIGGLHWPVPKSFGIEGLDEIYYGYEDEILLFSDVAIAPDAQTPLQLAASVSWLLCLDDGVCIPGSSNVTMELPLESKTESAPTSKIFDHYQARLPISVSETGLNLESKWDTKAGHLSVHVAEPLRIVRDHKLTTIAWFPNSGGTWTVDIIDPQSLVIRPLQREEPLAGGILILPIAEKDNVRTLHSIAIDDPEP